MKTAEEGRLLLQAAGYVLVRSRKHSIYRHPQLGTTVIMPTSPADYRTIKNLRAEIARNERIARSEGRARR